jgi:hypothetical protein
MLGTLYAGCAVEDVSKSVAILTSCVVPGTEGGPKVIQLQLPDQPRLEA